MHTPQAQYTLKQCGCLIVQLFPESKPDTVIFQTTEWMQNFIRGNIGFSSKNMYLPLTSSKETHAPILVIHLLQGTSICISESKLHMTTDIFLLKTQKISKQELLLVHVRHVYCHRWIYSTEPVTLIQGIQFCDKLSLQSYFSYFIRRQSNTIKTVLQSTNWFIIPGFVACA